MKVCTKCQKDLPSEDFYRSKWTVTGLTSWCKECTCKRAEQRRIENREETLEYARQYAKQYRVEYPERVQAHNRRYRESHKEYYKDYGRVWFHKQFRANPRFHISHNMRRAIWQAVRSRKAGSPWEELVGYGVEDLMKHLEQQFQDGMTWGNYGEWHIDHIRPIASFSYESPEEEGFRACWALSNLQPLWAKENLKKGKKLV